MAVTDRPSVDIKDRPVRKVHISKKIKKKQKKRYKHNFIYKFKVFHYVFYVV